MKIWIDMTMLKDEHFNYFVEKYPKITFESNIENAYDADAIFCMPGIAVKNKLELFPNLKWIQLLTAGYDPVDVDYIHQRNIVLTNAKDVFSIQIAEDVISKILYFNKNIKAYAKQMENGLWKHHKVDYEISLSTIGIIGTGSIGLEVAKRLKAFETNVVGYKRTRVDLPYFDKIYYGKEGLHQVLKESDYVIISLPLNKNTYHLIGKKELEMMKPSALLINVARGDIINQDALVEALSKKTIRGAGLDVTSPEPLPSDHLLWKLDNVFITPHNSSSGPYMIHRLIDEVDDTLKRYINEQELDNTI
jgi:D-2-hydroxyacid dehydrogenase (NADP+)